ncbi:hypothetical protein NM208_g10115 [Fusarium decemcellulare]|uniref:Uncharacterized protein n=1 Tax=Fusarium decemcellulare TaxID=57161 RepID=A0ACC1RZ62_9HYPO|nr:hypothetical protein NM208_g10115 [Fusarium decemcellulare]
MTESGLLTAQQPIEVAPALRFQFLVRHGASLDRFLDVIIPFSCVINQAIVTDFKSKDEAALDTLIAFRAMDLSELHDNINMPDDDAKDLEGTDLQSPGRTPLITKTVRHMRVEVDWDRVFEVKSLTFYRDWQELGNLSSDREDGQEVMSNPTIVAKPYTRYLTGVRTTYKDLTFNNLGSLTPKERPDRPVPATTIFINGEHRLVLLISGAVEEQEMHDARAAELLKTPLPAVFIRDVLSKCCTPGSYHLGDKCTFFIDTPSANRKMPSVAPTAAQIGNIILEMVRQFHLAEQRARRAEDHCNEEIRAAEGKNDDSRVQYLLEQLDKKKLQAFMGVASQID